LERGRHAYPEERRINEGTVLNPVGAGTTGSYRVLIVLALTVAVGTAGMGIVTPLLPIFADELGASGIWLGLVFSGFAITQTPLVPIIGRLSDQFGRKPFIAIGLLVYSSVALGMSVAPNYQTLAGWRIFGGVGAAMIFPVALAYVGDIAPKGREGTYAGLFNLAFLSGWGLGPLMGGLLKDAFGMDWSFYAMAAFTTFAMVLVLLLVPESPHRVATDSDRQGPSDVRQALSCSTVRAVLAFHLAWSILAFSTLAFIGVHLKDNLGASTALIGATISAKQVSGGLLQAPGGRLADSFSRVKLVSGAMVISALGISGVAVLDSLALAVLLYVSLGLMDGIAYPAAAAIAVDEGRQHGMGGTMGLTNMASSLGLIAGTVLGGVVVDALGIRSFFLIAGAAAVGGALAFSSLMFHGERRRVSPVPAPIEGASRSSG
jgi:MFS family permease